MYNMCGFHVLSVFPNNTWGMYTAVLFAVSIRVSIQARRGFFRILSQTHRKNCSSANTVAFSHVLPCLRSHSLPSFGGVLYHDSCFIGLQDEVLFSTDSVCSKIQFLKLWNSTSTIFYQQREAQFQAVPRQDACSVRVTESVARRISQGLLSKPGATCN